MVPLEGKLFAYEEVGVVLPLLLRAIKFELAPHVKVEPALTGMLIHVKGNLDVIVQPRPDGAR